MPLVYEKQKKMFRQPIFEIIFLGMFSVNFLHFPVIW